MIATFFEWVVDQDRQDDFVALWNEGTALLLEHGSLGSALFKADNGRFHALTRWPDRATRDAAFAATADAPVFIRMRACVTKTVRSDDADELSNLWRWRSTH